MKIAVTGCSGFIGSWICEKLINAGHGVVGLDNLSSGVDYTRHEVNFHKVDLNDDIQDYIKNVDFVVHAAAYADLRNNWKNKSERDKVFLNNETATRSLLEQMPNVPIILLSTAAVYGSLSNSKIINNTLTEENAITESIESPYAASKLACETYVAAWSHKRKTNFYNLRLVNQIGPRSHHGVITDFLQMVKEKKHIHALDNGQQKKNWVSVEDTAHLVVRLLQNDVPSGNYTVTSDERWSWRDFVQVMREMHYEKYKDEPFTLTYEECLAGSVGDPINLNVSGEKLKPYYVCNKSIKKAVRDTLTYLGWAK